MRKKCIGDELNGLRVRTNKIGLCIALNWYDWILR